MQMRHIKVIPNTIRVPHPRESSVMSQSATGVDQRCSSIDEALASRRTSREHHFLHRACA